MTERVKASFSRRSWSHGLGSIRTLASRLVAALIRPGSAWRLRTSSKFSGIRRNPQQHRVTGNSLSRCGFLQSRSSYRNEKCVNRPTVSVWCCPKTEGWICTTITTNAVVKFKPRHAKHTYVMRSARVCSFFWLIFIRSFNEWGSAAW